MAKAAAPKVEELLAPAKALTELTLANLEKVASLNADLYTKYVNLVLDNVRAAMKVADADSAKSFMEKQNSVAKEVVDSIIADTKIYSELNQEYTAEVQKLVTAEVEKVAKKAA